MSRNNDTLRDDHITTTTANNNGGYYYEKPSNAWIWIIAILMVVIIGFFALGGTRLFDNTNMSQAEISSATSGTQ